MKKTLKLMAWMPWMTLGLTILMVWLYAAGHTVDLAVNGSDTGWVRGLHVFSSQLGHFDRGHIIGNMVAFAIVGPAVELLVSRWVFPIALALCALESFVFDTDGGVRYLGFSGVVYFLLGVAGIAVIAKYGLASWTYRTDAWGDVKGAIGNVLFLTWAMMLVIEITLVIANPDDSINHTAHLNGAVMGTVLAFLRYGIPALRELVEHLRRRAAYRARVVALRAERQAAQVSLGTPGFGW